MRWDEQASGWVPADDAVYEVSGGVLTAQIDRWSAWSWMANKLKTAHDRVARRVVGAAADAAQWAADKNRAVWKWTTDWQARAVDLLNLGQTLREWVGRAASAPECAEGPLPTWVESASSPERLMLGVRLLAPIRLCYEKGDDDALRMRLANNRNYGQLIRSDPADSYGDYSLDGFRRLDHMAPEVGCSRVAVRHREDLHARVGFGVD